MGLGSAADFLTDDFLPSVGGCFAHGGYSLFCFAGCLDVICLFCRVLLLPMFFSKGELK